MWSSSAAATTASPAPATSPKAGLSVGVFERRSILGGAAVTEEFHPGFRNSTASYTVSLLNPKVIQRPAPGRARPEGARAAHAELPAAARWPRAHRGPGQRAAPRRRSAASRHATRNACPPTTRCSTRPSTLLRSQLLETPPADPRRLRDLWGALQMGRSFRKLDAAVQRDIHELFTRSAGDLLDHWFETDAVKALYGFDAVVGSYASPYTPGQRLRTAAPCIRRSERQDRRLGTCGRRHGSDHAGHGSRGAPAGRHSRNRCARETHRRRARSRHRHRARGWTRDPGQRGRREPRTQTALS